MKLIILIIFHHIPKVGVLWVVPIFCTSSSWTEGSLLQDECIAMNCFANFTKQTLKHLHIWLIQMISIASSSFHLISCLSALKIIQKTATCRTWQGKQIYCLRATNRTRKCRLVVRRVQSALAIKISCCSK